MVAFCEKQADEIHCVICWSRDHGHWLATCLRPRRRASIAQAMNDMVESVGKMVRIRREVPERM